MAYLSLAPKASFFIFDPCLSAWCMTPSQNPTLRITLLPRDTNARGTIFGGVILSHLDLAGAIAAQRHAARNFVTRAMREVEFIAPVYVGDVVSFYAKAVHEGKTSLTIRVEVEAARNSLPESTVRVTEAEIVYVAIDNEGKPTSIR
jgi:acyl-CoA thioesterase YciA